MYLIEDYFDDDVQPDTIYKIFELPSLVAFFKRGSELIALSDEELDDYPQLYYDSDECVLYIGSSDACLYLEHGNEFLDTIQIAVNEDNTVLSIAFLGDLQWKYTISIENGVLSVDGVQQFIFKTNYSAYITSIYHVTDEIFKIRLDLMDDSAYNIGIVSLFVDKDALRYFSLEHTSGEFKHLILHKWKCKELDIARAKIIYALGDELGKRFLY